MSEMSHFVRIRIFSCKYTDNLKQSDILGPVTPVTNNNRKRPHYINSADSESFVLKTLSEG